MAPNEKPPNREERRLAQFGPPPPLGDTKILVPDHPQSKNLFQRMAAKLDEINDRFAGAIQLFVNKVFQTENFKTTRNSVLAVEGVVLFSVGTTAMQIGEWFFAIVLFVALGILLFAKSLTLGHWLKSVLACIGSILLAALLITITPLRKPDSEPWSNLQKLWPQKQQNPQSQPAADVPPKFDEMSEGDRVEYSISKRKFLVFPRQAGSKKTNVMMQLEPSTYEDDRERSDINALGVSFDNASTRNDSEISVTVSLSPLAGWGPKPSIENVDCHNKDRVKILDGGPTASFVQLFVPQLIPEENQTCTISLMQAVDHITTVTEWKKLFGTPKARSANFGKFDVLIYRNRISVKKPSPPNSSPGFLRATTIEVK